MLEKDSRIVIMDEVLSGIKALKLYAWEESFLSKIMQIRNRELKYLRNACCLNAITEFTFTCAPFLVSFMSIIFKSCLALSSLVFFFHLGVTSG